MKLNVKAFSVAGGVLWALWLFLMTWMNILGYGDAPTMIKSYYIGYATTPLGSVIGAAWAFFDAGIGCAVFAFLYNKMAR